MIGNSVDANKDSGAYGKYGSGKLCRFASMSIYKDYKIALYELFGGFCANHVLGLFANPKCKIVWLAREEDEIDHVDWNKYHHCCRNTIPLCASCNCVKRTLQLKSIAMGSFVSTACGFCGLVSEMPVIRIQDGKDVALAAVNDYHRLHGGHELHICVSKRVRLPADVDVDTDRQVSSTTDANFALTSKEREASKHTLTRKEQKSEYLWPRFRYWSIFLHQLGYPITPDVLKDTIPAELGIRRGTIMNNYYATITAPFSGLWQDVVTDRLADFERNPDIEEDEYEQYFKDIIRQWSLSGNDETRFRQALNDVPIRHLATLFKMTEQELLKRAIVRLKQAPIFKKEDKTDA